MPPNKATKRPQTETALRAIWDYIANRSLRAADVVLVEMEAKFDFLADTPFAGRSRPELAQNIRSFPVGSYVIFYITVPTGIDVVRVMDGRQDITSTDFT